MHAFPAVGSNADTLTQSQMFADKDCLDSVRTQAPGIDGLQKMDVFDIKKISKLPPKAHLLSSILSYHRKISPIGKILKYKVCLFVDGSQQEFGRDFWETYAPVISWSTI
jgi:hypothetical protein